jgi:23S rRNA pseudouridine2605 synthase
MAEPQRIAKLLARAGVASRREIERMIADGRVAIDGVAINTPATILRSLKGVTVDGQPVAEPEQARLFLYHKPTGVLTAANDPAGRRTIYDRIPDGLPRVVPVGRLDLNTEGLLLLTNDGGLKRRLELPATGVERTYRARCYGDVTQEALEALSEGIEIEGVRYGSIDANMERRTGANAWIEMRLREGKNREVRRVLEYLGLEVNRLIRTAYGPFVLADLPVADAVEVLQHDLVSFLKDLERGAPSAMDAPRTVPTVSAEHAPGRAPVRAAGRPRPLAERSRPGGEFSKRPAPARAAAGAPEVGRPTPARVAPAPGAGPRGGSHADPAERRGVRSASLRGGQRDETPARGAAADKPARTPRARDATQREAPGVDTRQRAPARPSPASGARAKAAASPATDPAEQARTPRPVKGKGWAKASKPAKRVGIGAGKPKRPKLADRPMGDAREDYQAGPPAPAKAGRPPRGSTAGGSPSPVEGGPKRGAPAGRSRPTPPRPGKS